MEGCVFNVQRYSVHDGPGIRTIVFLKGCPLHCKWCSNPESQLVHPQIAYNIEKCIGEVCMRCGDVCPQHNMALMDTNKILINHSNCIHCLKCSTVCPAKAITCYGNTREVKELMDEVEADQVFHSRSGGGLTLSGGEPLMQHEFAKALLQEAKNRRMHTCIETCGCAPWEDAKDVFALLDYVLFDIKSLDSAQHQRFTGQGNEMILDTFRKLREVFPQKPVCVRTPIVPGFNDTPEDIIAIRDFVKQFPNTTYEVLKYHRFGSQKYGYIGRTYELGTEELTDEQFEYFVTLCKS